MFVALIRAIEVLRYFTVIPLDKLAKPVLEMPCPVTVMSGERFRGPPEDHVVQDAR